MLNNNERNKTGYLPPENEDFIFITMPHWITIEEENRKIVIKCPICMRDSTYITSKLEKFEKTACSHEDCDTILIFNKKFYPEE